jgi:tRNA splicing ligase
MTNKMNADIKKVVNRVKAAQQTLQSYLKKQDWVEEARKYAEKQGKEVRKLFGGDLAKVKSFLEKERRELEKFQKQLPEEVKKLRTFVKGQRKELQKLLVRVGKVRRTTKKSARPKTSRAKKSSASA